MKKYLIKLIDGTKTTDVFVDTDDTEGAEIYARVYAKAKGAKVLAIYELRRVSPTT